MHALPEAQLCRLDCSFYPHAVSNTRLLPKSRILTCCNYWRTVRYIPDRCLIQPICNSNFIVKPYLKAPYCPLCPFTSIPTQFCWRAVKFPFDFSSHTMLTSGRFSPKALIAVQRSVSNMHEQMGKNGVGGKT